MGWAARHGSGKFLVRCGAPVALPKQLILCLSSHLMFSIPAFVALSGEYYWPGFRVVLNDVPGLQVRN